MEKFARLILLYTIVSGALIFGIPFFFAGPYTDAFYMRFTSPKKASLVIGTSRAAQAIVPEVINKELNSHGIQSELYNYSFTIKSSPFGEAYLKSILKKIDRTLVEDRTKVKYLIAVDPWSVSTLFYKVMTGAIDFEEQRYAPANMHDVDSNPNLEYVYKNVDNRLLMMIRRFRHQNHPKLMQDGSLNIALGGNQEMLRMTTVDRINEYKTFAKNNSYSPIRFSWLGTTLDSLNRWGKCYLVRLPVHPGMREVERKFMPDFDERISRLAAEYDIPYLNYMPLCDSLHTIDGNHLDRKSAIFLSRVLANDLVRINGLSPTE